MLTGHVVLSLCLGYDQLWWLCETSFNAGQERATYIESPLRNSKEGGVVNGVRPESF